MATAVVLFDGVCNLCTGSVQFILQRDRRGYFRFASLQSATGQRLRREYGLPEDRIESVVLIEDGQAYTQSEAALRIARHLSGLWPLLSMLLLVPRPLRDAVYDWIAIRRYGWFGRTEVCWVPTPELQERFLE